MISYQVPFPGLFFGQELKEPPEEEAMGPGHCSSIPEGQPLDCLTSSGTASSAGRSSRHGERSAAFQAAGVWLVPGSWWTHQNKLGWRKTNAGKTETVYYLIFELWLLVATFFIMKSLRLSQPFVKCFFFFAGNSWSLDQLRRVRWIFIFSMDGWNLRTLKLLKQ